MTSRSVAALAVFIALVAALGFAFAPVPNVELVGLASFVAGFVLGGLRGAVAAGGGMALYSGLNPYGLAMPPVYVAQIAGMAVFALAGARAGAAVASRSPGPASLLAGAMGLALTLLYDLLTNLGTVVVMGAWNDPVPVIVGGIVFGTWHLVSNTVLFAVLLPPLLRAVRRRHLERLV